MVCDLNEMAKVCGSTAKTRHEEDVIGSDGHNRDLGLPVTIVIAHRRREDCVRYAKLLFGPEV